MTAATRWTAERTAGRRRLGLAIALVALVVGLAGCSGDGDAEAGTRSVAPPAPTSVAIGAARPVVDGDGVAWLQGTGRDGRPVLAVVRPDGTVLHPTVAALDTFTGPRGQAGSLQTLDGAVFLAGTACTDGTACEMSAYRLTLDGDEVAATAVRTPVPIPEDGSVGVVGDVRDPVLESAYVIATPTETVDRTSNPRRICVLPDGWLYALAPADEASASVGLERRASGGWVRIDASAIDIAQEPPYELVCGAGALHATAGEDPALLRWDQKRWQPVEVGADIAWASWTAPDGRTYPIQPSEDAGRRTGLTDAGDLVQADAATEVVERRVAVPPGRADWAHASDGPPPSAAVAVGAGPALVTAVVCPAAADRCDLWWQRG
jgi:hypothetical protein